ncbi:MAG: DNA-3-methyladenine glycosylase 2 family protein [Alphaproteobacteria bacterium]|nr:DNA-3-methyladenine glycosylase 2 family protein [Alphaproteobacteria bacterium]
MSARIDAETLARAVADLAARDADFARVVDRHGHPPLRLANVGFEALLQIIVEQQLSVASAAAIWGRVRAAMADPTPEAFLALDDAALKSCGLSRGKMLYGRHLAERVRDGALAVHALHAMDDDAAIAELVKVKGIGRWTAEIYLLAALARPDTWPAGDLALQTAAGHLKGMRRRPSEAALRAMGEAWRPWRAVAARLLWHFFRHEKLRPLPPPVARTKRAAKAPKGAKKHKRATKARTRRTARKPARKPAARKTTRKARRTRR